MGCWNKTCGLSNLHITAGTDVYVFALTKNSYSLERCYANAFWKPVLIPFYSKYDNYGGGEESHGVGLDIILNNIKEHLVDLEQGDNQYHDIPVKKESFDVEKFFEAVHENRLIVDKDTEVDFVMFRKDVVDHILENWIQEEYVGQGKGTSGWGNSYIKYKFEDILRDIPECIQRIKEFLGSDENSTLHEFKPRMFECSGINTIFEYGNSNKAGTWLRGDSWRFSQIGSYTEKLLDLILADKIDDAAALLKDVLIGRYLDCFMEVTRKNWGPAGHEGSQGNDTHSYRVLIQAMTNVLDNQDRDQAEYDD